MLSRSKRDDRTVSLANVGSFCSNNAEGWMFLDTISVAYDKPSSCSNSGLLPISELGFLFYKGTTGPNIQATSWFKDDRQNATNVWDLGVNPLEAELVGTKHTYHQRFSWEMNLLMYSLSTPMAYRNFIYMPKLTEAEAVSLCHFCKKFSVKVQIIAKTADYADKIIGIFNDLRKKK
jgi:hypothetical protein